MSPSLAEEVRADRKAACKLPDRLTPSQWAERHRVLSAKESPEPGPWSNARTPFAVGIMDAVVEPGVEEVTYVKPTQVCGSEGCRNVLGFWIEEDPGPCLYVMPSELAVKKQLEKRLKPMFQSAALRHHFASEDDITQQFATADTMDVFFGWAGSPQALASDPCRYVILDEVDKYPPFAGREADPISLARERTKNFLHRKRIFKISTPTTRTGAIWVEWESCGDKRRYHVPCPHCSHYQVLAFPQIKWPKPADGPGGDKVAMADRIEREKSAWYECANPECKGVIRDHHKPKMLARGKWVSEGQTIDRDGVIHGPRPDSRRVGFHLNAIYSPWINFYDVACKFIRADGDAGATMNFRNSWLAEPFEQQVSKREPSAIRRKVEEAKARGLAGKRRVVPSWAVLLFATVDVQQGYTWWQVSAWGHGQRCKVVDAGTCHGGGADDAAILRALQATHMEVFNPQFPMVMETGVPVAVQEMYVDAKYKKAVVTQFAQQDPRRVYLTEGLSGYSGPIATPKVERVSGVLVWSINTMQSKDTLDRLIADPDPDKWQVHDETDDVFCDHLASEHKILDPHSRQLAWQKKSSGAQNHQWDNAANAAAIAAAKGAAMPAPPVAPAPAPARDAEASNPLNYKGKW